ncbi:MAG: hypothetical protein BV457_08435 [Thermoplasmata archaeon M9B1D]|nr:MAG: hypothetical protein BV457_08435 [Thermoplasmata archaeon M9B1D]
MRDLAKFLGVEEDKEFKIGNYIERYKIIGNILMYSRNEVEWYASTADINGLINAEIIPIKTFTEDEKVIARNIDKKYKWIARDKEDDLLCIYKNKPLKEDISWIDKFHEYTLLDVFQDLFKSIQWEDSEPTLIEDIYKED